MVKKEDDFIVDDDELEAESGSEEAEFTGSGSDTKSKKKTSNSKSKKAAPASKNSKAKDNATKPAAKVRSWRHGTFVTDVACRPCRLTCMHPSQKRKVSDDEEGDDKPEGKSCYWEIMLFLPISPIM
jgi:hypothetical protein